MIEESNNRPPTYFIYNKPLTIQKSGEKKENLFGKQNASNKASEQRSSSLLTSNRKTRESQAAPAVGDQ
jgi:hypothetical protein